MLSYKISEVEYVVDDIRVLLNNVGEHLGIYKGNGELLVKRVVVPIHLGEADDPRTGVVPTSIACEPAYQYRRRGRLESAFLVHVVAS